MRWTRGAFLGAAAVAIAAACSSFDDSPVAPGETDGGDGGGVDTGPGGGPVDGATPPDANAPDAFSDGGACVPVPSGCDGGIHRTLDFSASTMPPLGWDDDSELGTIAHVAEAGPCSPGFMRAAAQVPNDASASAQAHIAQLFPGTFRTARLAFAFRGPAPLEDGYANVGCAIVFRTTTNPSARSNIRLTLEEIELVYSGSVRTGDGGVVDSGPDTVVDDEFTLSEAAQWHTFDATFDVTNTTVTVSAVYDKKALPKFVVPLVVPATRVDVECGINYSDKENASYTHDIDDAFVELCP